MEKWKDRKNLVFPHVCFVEGIENSFIWLKRKVGG